MDEIDRRGSREQAGQRESAQGRSSAGLRLGFGLGALAPRDRGGISGGNGVAP